MRSPHSDYIFSIMNKTQCKPFHWTNPSKINHLFIVVVAFDYILAGFSVESTFFNHNFFCCCHRFICRICEKGEIIWMYKQSEFYLQIKLSKLTWTRQVLWILRKKQQSECIQWNRRLVWDERKKNEQKRFVRTNSNEKNVNWAKSMNEQATEHTTNLIVVKGQSIGNEKF